MSVIEGAELRASNSPSDYDSNAGAVTEVNTLGSLADSTRNPDAIWNTLLDAPRPSKMQTYWTTERLSKWVDENLHLMAVPSAYYGNEIGTYQKDQSAWDYAPFRVAAIGGSSYTGLAGNLGIPLVYSLVNDQNESFICERGYFPMSRSDLDRFRDRGLPMFTLESKRDVREYDTIMFSGSYCGVDINIIKMLEMSGIPIEYDERDERWPIIGRGGCHSFSPEPFWKMYDWIYIGDAEPQLSNVLRAQARGVNEGWTKWETMWYMATTTDFRTDAEIKAGKRGIPGVYIPAFFEEQYFKQGEDGKKYPSIKDRVRNYDEIRRLVGQELIESYEGLADGKSFEAVVDAQLPIQIDRVYIKDLNEEYQFTKQVVSMHDPGMSAGTLLVSRGCNAKCSFCQEGMTWMPYRELSSDIAAESLGAIMKETGSLNVLPSAFCASSYTQKKQLMLRTLEGYSDQIKLISQRVDEMAEDENFVMLTGFMGNDTCSLGVEGNSQRVRDMLNKNCTEDELLTATSHLLRAGYKKIKYFMIANIPGETRDDVLEVVQLAEKAANLRNELGAKCDIKFSWTPLVIQSFTPMQFCRPTLEKRSLSEVFPLGVSFRLGSGAKYDEAYLMQLLHLGDRRIWPIIKALVTTDMAVKGGMVHYGSTPKGVKVKIEDMLHETFPDFVPNEFVNADGETEIENIWDVFFHEKTYDEILSWQFINVAVTHDYLWKRYLDFQNAVQTTKCDQLCDQCGVCDKFDHSLRFKLHENEDPEVDLKSIKVIKQRGNVQRIRFKISTPANLRFVENEYWKFVFRRALYKIDSPFDKRSAQFASDVIPFRNHLYGVDYVDAKFFEGVDQDAIIRAIQTSDEGNLLGDWEILGAKSYTSGMTNVRSVADMSHYRMPFDTDDAELVAQKLQKVIDADEFIVTLKSEGFMGVEKEEIDARPFIHDLWAHADGSTLMVDMILKNRLSPYDMYKALFPIADSKLFAIPAQRIDSYLPVDEDQEDFFRPTCIETGRPIEVDLFDNPVDEDYCLRAKYLLSGKLIAAH
jgi:radical SAM superfamily enzyme YgiQ (UPF0313 family)